MTGSAHLDMSQVRQLWQIGWRLLGGLLYARIKAVMNRGRGLLELGRIWVLSGKREADVARPNGRPFDQILAGRLTSTHARLDWG